MVLQQYSLSWEKHQASICNGFRDFQQNGDFVDMTLAAEGHHVKVHKMMMGVASTYFRSLINTADAKHPIVYLHNISYETLLCLLEFIYTGEVAVQEDKLSDFINTAQKLQISGLLDLRNEQGYQPNIPATQELPASEHKKAIDSLFFKQLAAEEDVDAGADIKPEYLDMDPLAPAGRASAPSDQRANELRKPHLQHTRQGKQTPEQSGATQMFEQLSLSTGTQNWVQGQGYMQGHTSGQNIQGSGNIQGLGYSPNQSVHGSRTKQGAGQIQQKILQGSGNIQIPGNMQSLQGQGQCTLCPPGRSKLTLHTCLECSQWACPGHLTQTNVCSNCIYSRGTRTRGGKPQGMWD